MIQRRVFLYVFVLIALFIANMIISQLTFLTNLEIVSIQSAHEKLNFENKELNVQVSRLEAVDVLFSKAVKLGFEKNSRVFYLTQPELAHTTTP